MKKRIIVTVSVILAVFVLGISAGMGILYFDGLGISTGTVLKTENGTCFLVKESSPIRLSFVFEDTQKNASYETGDKLLVIHDGIQESYPAVTGVYFSLKLGGGQEDDIPETVIKSLTQLGWTPEADSQGTDIEFSAEYIKTNHPSADSFESIHFPVLTVINTSDELDAYYNEYKEKYGLGESYTEAVKKYDSEFFSENTLIAAFIEEGSGSNTHTVEKAVCENENTLSVYINTNYPDAGTCDMAYHHIFVAIKKGDTAGKNIRLIFNGKDASVKWEKVSKGTEDAYFSVYLPEGWNYEELTQNSYGELISEGTFGISIYNENAPEDTVTVKFTSFFGVCGTGLTTQDITLGDYKAHKGIYDGNPTFDYIVFEDTSGYYVIYNNTDMDWWSKYGDTLMEILDTIEIAE